MEKFDAYGVAEFLSAIRFSIRLSGNWGREAETVVCLEKLWQRGIEINRNPLEWSEVEKPNLISFVLTAGRLGISSFSHKLDLSFDDNNNTWAEWCKKDNLSSDGRDFLDGRDRCAVHMPAYSTV